MRKLTKQQKLIGITVMIALIMIVGTVGVNLTANMEPRQPEPEQIQLQLLGHRDNQTVIQIIQAKSTTLWTDTTILNNNQPLQQNQLLIYDDGNHYIDTNEGFSIYQLPSGNNIIELQTKGQTIATLTVMIP